MKDIIKLFEQYIDFIQSAEDHESIENETDIVIQKLYKLKLKHETF